MKNNDKTDINNQALTLHEITKRNELLHVKFLDEIFEQKKILESIPSLSPVDDTAIAVSDLKSLLNLESAIIISQLDLGVIVNHLYLYKDELTSHFFIRHGYLTLHESIDTINKHKKTLRNITLKMSTTYREEHGRCMMIMKRFTRDHDLDKIRVIRNIIGGHIHHDFSSWHKTLTSLGSDELVKMLIDFSELTQSLVLFVRSLKNHIMLDFQNGGNH
jgi:hypothetical protein